MFPPVPSHAGCRGNAKRGNPSVGQFATWGYQGQINIKSSQIDGALTNFPVLLDSAILSLLPYDIWSFALNGGGDLRFSSDIQGANRLACEIVTFNTATNTAEIYVNVPSVSSVIDTPIYIFYGKAGVSQPAVSAAYGRNATWNSDFLFVGHMDSGQDSTGKTTYMGGSASIVAGKVGQASDFDGSSNYYDYNNLSGPAGTAATWEFWTNFDGLAIGTRQSIMSTDTDPNSFHINQPLSGSNCDIYLNPPNTLISSSWNYTASTWQHTSIGVDTVAGDLVFRLNYSTVSSPGVSTGFNLELNQSPVIGAWYDGGFQRYLNGRIDELRLSKVFRALEWRKASYINQNLTTDFLEIKNFIS